MQLVGCTHAAAAAAAAHPSLTEVVPQVEPTDAHTGRVDSAHDCRQHTHGPCSQCQVQALQQPAGQDAAGLECQEAGHVQRPTDAGDDDVGCHTGQAPVAQGAGDRHHNGEHHLDGKGMDGTR